MFLENEPFEVFVAWSLTAKCHVAAVSVSDVWKTGKLTPNDVDARVRLQARMKICKCDFEVCGPFKWLISVAAWEVKVSPGGRRCEGI